MFQKEQQLIEDKIKDYTSANEIPLAELKWQPIPFSGEWGVSTSFFQTAANEARVRPAVELQGERKKVPVPQRAQEIATSLKGAKDFAAAVKRAGLEIKTTELLARGSAIPDLGMSEAIDAAAFSLPQGGVSDAISTPTGTAVIRVVERVDVTDAEIEQGKDALREELVNQRRDRFFGAYMEKAKGALRIDIRQEILAQVTGA